MLASFCSATRLTGSLLFQELKNETPLLRMRALHAESGALLGESFSAPDGQFAIDLPLVETSHSDFHLPVRVEALDGQNTVLSEGQLEVRPGEHASLTLQLPSEPAEIVSALEISSPRLVNPGAAAWLRQRVQGFVDRDELPAEALVSLENALRPLEWAGDLQEEANRALEGDRTAAARLKASLLGWGIQRMGDDAFEPGEKWEADGPCPGSERGAWLLDVGALLPLTLAAVHSAEDAEEAQLMLDGLSAAVWSRPWVELLYSAAQQGDPAPMRTLMMPMPGDTPVLPRGGPLGGPGNLGWPNVPEKKTGPMRANPTAADLVPRFRTPKNLPPSEKERCQASAMAEVAQIKQALPRYTIRTLDNPNACAGQLLTIRGENFGKSGKVVFPGPAKPIDSTQAVLWSDTTIQVVVPLEAAPGFIQLQILAQHLRRCCQDFFIYRLGDTLPEFTGGIPQILSLWIDNVQGNTSAAPQSSVNVWFETSQGSGVTTRLTVTHIWGGMIFQTPPLPGGAHAIKFTTPYAERPTDLNVTVQAWGACQTAELAYTLTLARQPDLRISEVEVTQGIQRLNNTVRLAAQHRTMVRLYLTGGVSFFSYTGTPDQLPNVTGSVTLWRGSQRLTTVRPTKMTFTAENSFQLSDRQTLAKSLNFTLPPQDLKGPVRLEIRVWVDPLPHGVLSGPHTSDMRSLDLNFEATTRVKMVRVRLQDDSRGLPAPDDNDFDRTADGAQSLFPLPEEGFEFHWMPGQRVISINHDLKTKDGWINVLEDLDDLAEDTANAWGMVWAGVLPAELPNVPKEVRMPFNGMGRQGDGEDNYPAMVCQSRLPTTFAHELAHVFGYGHAGCPSSGPDMPEGIDSSLPMYIEEVAIDTYSDKIFSPGALGAGELMSYCSGNGRFTSINLWHKLLDLLKV